MLKQLICDKGLLHKPCPTCDESVLICCSSILRVHQYTQ